jgi:hypothetical protein
VKPNTLIAFACGGDEGQQPGAPGPAGGAGEADVASEAAAAADPSVQSCLDLVRAGSYAEAIAPCTEAVRRAPENREVQTALDQARSGAAEAMAGAAEEAAAGADAAGEEAASQLEGATEKGLPEALP